MSSKPVVHITDWIIAPHPKYEDNVLFGVPVDHPNPFGFITNKKMIVSSPISTIDEEHSIVETMNTRYVLVGEGISKQELSRRLTHPGHVYR